MWQNVVERDRPQMAVWRVYIACWITKATQYTLTLTHTHSHSLTLSHTLTPTHTHSHTDTLAQITHTYSHTHTHSHNHTHTHTHSHTLTLSPTHPLSHTHSRSHIHTLTHTLTLTHLTSKHVVLLYCNGACSVNKGYIKKNTHTHAHTHTHSLTHTLHTLPICNIYCFSTIRTVAWTCLTVMLYVHQLSSCTVILEGTVLLLLARSGQKEISWCYERIYGVCTNTLLCWRLLIRTHNWAHGCCSALQLS